MPFIKSSLLDALSFLFFIHRRRRDSIALVGGGERNGWERDDGKDSIMQIRRRRQPPQPLRRHWFSDTNRRSPHLPAMDEAPAAAAMTASLWTCFMCSISASLPRKSLWHKEQHVVLGPPINAACYCKTIKKFDLKMAQNFSENLSDACTAKRIGPIKKEKGRIFFFVPCGREQQAYEYNIKLQS